MSARTVPEETGPHAESSSDRSNPLTLPSRSMSAGMALRQASSDPSPSASSAGFEAISRPSGVPSESQSTKASHRMIAVRTAAPASGPGRASVHVPSGTPSPERQRADSTRLDWEGRPGCQPNDGTAEPSPRSHAPPAVRNPSIHGPAQANPPAFIANALLQASSAGLSTAARCPAHAAAKSRDSRQDHGASANTTA
jgi:hypothetical protein